MDKIKVAVLGGGYAGVHAAKKIYKSFKKLNDQVEITLIDKFNFHTLMTELHEVAGNRVDEDAVKITFDRIFAGTTIRVLQDTIEDVDFEKKLLKSSDQTYQFDYLLICTGGEPTDFNIPGIKDNSFTLWSLDDAITLREHIRATVEDASLEKDLQKRSEMMTFVTAGAGFTGIEMLGELVEWLPLLCDEYGVEREEITLICVEGLNKILPMLPDKPRKKAEKYLLKKGADIRVNSLIVKADENGFTLKNGTEIRTKTLVWTCGVKGSSFCEKLSIADGKVGRKQVNKYMQSPDYKNVFLAGDGMWFIEDERPVPQIVEAAEQTAAVAANGIIFQIKKSLGLKTQEVKPFKSNFHGYMVSIGGRYGVSHNMGVSLSGFFALAVKHFVNMIYHQSVCGPNGWWTYLKHEIVDIRNNRSLLGGLAVYKVPSYWMVMLRMFLGVMWLIEGIKKISDGWLADKAGSHVYWGAAVSSQAITETPSVVDTAASGMAAAAQGAAVAVDATAAASAAVYAGADAITSATTLATAVVPQFAPPLLQQPTGLYIWISETFVAAAPYFFQLVIVFVEIILGLCFLGGFFTFIAAAASIGLSAMLIMGAMASREIIWYMMVALVMMGGAGRALGLDYWVMPWIKKSWNKTPLAKKSYLYTGEPKFTKKQRVARKLRNKRK
ncbi:MAG: NAD(P)/FAD-dependent oxidoreductase [Bacteroidetes bacterium]|nr:NAD(P)/FAD-dependent oxidoreductase [Bacteroidota bacterium]